MPKSKPWTIWVDGGPELTHKLRLAGSSVAGVLQDAVSNGSDLVKDISIRTGPGPYIITETARPWTDKVKAYEIGPDKAHWYYRFFEFGVQPFEINMITKRSKRTAIDKKRSAKLGRNVAVRGRPIHSPFRAVKFSPTDIYSVVHPKGFAAKPFLRKAVRDNNAPIVKRVSDTFMAALNAIVGSP